MAYVHELTYHERKEWRRKLYESLHGVKEAICTACSGSGYYDHNGSPPCGGCNGSGKVRKSNPPSK